MRQILQRQYGTWVAFALIGSLIILAASAVTFRVVQLEVKKWQVDAQVDLETRMRLSLWRLEGIASNYVLDQESEGGAQDLQADSSLLEERQIPLAETIQTEELAQQAEALKGSVIDTKNQVEPQNLQKKLSISKSGQYQQARNTIEKAERSQIVNERLNKKSRKKPYLKNKGRTEKFSKRQKGSEGNEKSFSHSSSTGLSEESLDLQEDSDLSFAKKEDKSLVLVEGVAFEKLKGEMLERIADLLPQADLLKVDPSAAALDPDALVSLPLKLISNEGGYEELRWSWAPLRGPLGGAWLVVVLGVLASGFLLRGVMVLSERRATFVSSVTHELRTPLTTFRLYSELLESGMIKDEAKKQSYLGTLRRESERLNHLVENVLSYSRVERGNASAKWEKQGVGDLIGGMEPRFQDRAGEVGARVDISLQEESTFILTDQTACEQILFNLVDNACKYGVRKGEGARFLLTGKKGPRYYYFELRDHGPGVNPREQKKLFRAFHKSAQEASYTQPGVGLGLSLSRRLARALGGDLVILSVAGKGSCFQLRIPLER